MFTLKKIMLFLVLSGAVVFMVVLFFTNHSETKKLKISTLPLSSGVVPRNLITTSGYQEIAPLVQQPLANPTSRNNNRVVIKPVDLPPSIVIKGKKTPLDQLKTTKSPVEGGGTMIHLDDSYFVE